MFQTTLLLITGLTCAFLCIGLGFAAQPAAEDRRPPAFKDVASSVLCGSAALLAFAQMAGYLTSLAPVSAALFIVIGGRLLWLMLAAMRDHIRSPRFNNPLPGLAAQFSLKQNTDPSKITAGVDGDLFVPGIGAVLACLMIGAGAAALAVA